MDVATVAEIIRAIGTQTRAIAVIGVTGASAVKGATVETVSVEIAIATGIAVEIGIAAAIAAISALVIVRTSVNARSSAIVQSSVIAQISASAQSNETATSTAENRLLASRRPPARLSPARAPPGRTQVATALPCQDRIAMVARVWVSDARVVSVAGGAGADGAADGVEAAVRASKAMWAWLAGRKPWAPANPQRRLILPNHLAMRPRAVMDAKTLPQVKMPNRDGFTADSRPDWKSR